MDNILPISDKSCEEIVLGTLISNRNATDEVREILSEDCFHESRNKAIYNAIKSITEKGDSADALTVKSELEKTPYKMELYDLVQLSMHNTFDLVQHALRLKDLSIRRKFFDMSYRLLQAGTTESDDIADVIERMRSETDNIYSGVVNHTKTAYDYAEETYRRIKENMERKDISGTPTGFKAIDERGGLQPTNLILIAAEPSQGKTALAGCISVNAARMGAKIAFYSLEMTGCQLMTRFASMESGVSSMRIRNEQLADGEFEKVNKALGDLSGLPIFFDDRSTSNIDTIIASIRSLKIKQGVDGAVIDYLQILSINQRYNNVEAELAEAARRLKNLAKELNIWIIALSQLNRDNQNPEPTVNRLRGSGQINEAADMTLLIYRPEAYDRNYPKPYENTDPRGTALIDVAKGRNIGTFKFIAGFDSETTKFYELMQRPIITMNELKDANPF